MISINYPLAIPEGCSSKINLKNPRRLEMEQFNCRQTFQVQDRASKLTPALSYLIQTTFQFATTATRPLMLLDNWLIDDDYSTPIKIIAL